jgi:2,4-dienoyl-CoA reductase-like NADH-dependent reductase (Old Yellow Enzyme family)
MTSFESFRQEVADYIAKAGITATQFGREAMADPGFVFQMQRGRAPSLRTVDKVRDWMAKHPPNGS